MQTVIGIDVTPQRALALVVDVRTGQIENTLTGGSTDDLEPQVPKAIGIGIASDTPLAFSRPFVHASRARASVPGAGVASPSTMVLRFDDGACTLLMNSRIASHESSATMREDGILPGYFGYWFEPIPLDLSSDDSMLSFACMVRAKCESLDRAGVPVRRFVATRAIARTTPLLMQLLADVIDARIKLAESEHPEALGAAVLAALDARAHASLSLTVHAMAHVRRDLIYRPDIHRRKHFDELFASSIHSRAHLG